MWRTYVPVAAARRSRSRSRSARSGEVVAIDVHEGRLAQIAHGAEQLRTCALATTRAVDLAIGDGRLARTFDRVLVDAPCAGLST